MPIVAETEDGTMNRIMSNVAREMRALLRRGPSMKFGVNSAGDWLPPVLGSGDWSSAVMARKLEIGIHDGAGGMLAAWGHTE
jgi:hypothetical protein